MPDQDAGSLSFKLVYYGPAQSGKTTNLLRLHDILSPELKGEVMTMETKDDRTLFFDLLPLGFRVLHRVSKRDGVLVLIAFLAITLRLYEVTAH